MFWAQVCFFYYLRIREKSYSMSTFLKYPEIIMICVILIPHAGFLDHTVLTPKMASSSSVGDNQLQRIIRDLHGN